VILRLWHGWARPQDAAAYQQLLTQQIAPGIASARLSGLHDLTVLRRDGSELRAGDDVEFLTLMSFHDLEAVREFTGGEPSRSVVPPAARQLLRQHDEYSQHYVRLASYPGA